MDDAGPHRQRRGGLASSRQDDKAMLTAVVTGGLASGKSTATAHLRGRGATLIDADAIAHDLLIPPSDAIAEVVAAFGSAVATSDGTVDRKALAGIVFGDPDARLRLEAILHPRIRAAMAAAREAARARGAQLVVEDIPLFVESGGREGPMSAGIDVVLTICAPEPLRRRRAVQGRGMDPGDVRGRLAAQASDAEREAEADIVLDG
ncbi:MAG: dephospho-CoA kinase, partial [Bifidobacteriaceae bacterium]|nr:dephospho-CoA kinase [Bifidobacteriaceae bacterium]